MAGLGRNNKGIDIGAIDKPIIELTIEEKEKIHFRMCPGKPAQGFMDKPTNAIKPVVNQQPGIYGNPHGSDLIGCVIYGSFVTFVK
jgi:hypothetical protein